MWWRGLDTSHEIGWRQGEACHSKQYTSLVLSSDSPGILNKLECHLEIIILYRNESQIFILILT